jgi:nicotinamide-nucleotide amidase
MISQVRTLSAFGISESEIRQGLEKVGRHVPNVESSVRTDFPAIHIDLYARGEDGRIVEKRMVDAVCGIRRKFGSHLFSEQGLPMEAETGRLLSKKQATVSVAESCTGGLIAHWLTDVSGSSDYFLFGATTYSNDSKMDVLGVLRETIESYGAVHEETAREMAEGVRRITNSTYGLSTSGIAGPAGGTAGKPVGTLCIGIAGPNGSRGVRFHFPDRGRANNKKTFAMAALDLLRKEIIG